MTGWMEFSRFSSRTAPQAVDLHRCIAVSNIIRIAVITRVSCCCCDKTLDQNTLVRIAASDIYITVFKFCIFSSLSLSEYALTFLGREF